MIGCARCLHIFVPKWHRRSSSKKKVYFFKVSQPNFVFLPRAPRVLKEPESLFPSCACKHIRPQKISDFFEVFFSNLLFIGRFCGGQTRSTCSKSGLGPSLSGFETWGTKCIPKNFEGSCLYFVKTWGTKNILFSTKYHRHDPNLWDATLRPA